MKCSRRPSKSKRSASVAERFVISGKSARRRQIARANQPLVAQRASALDRVFELANVAWPAIALQSFERGGVDFFRLGAGLRGIFLQKMLHEQRDVLDAFAQRGHLDRDHRE